MKQQGAVQGQSLLCTVPSEKQNAVPLSGGKLHGRALVGHYNSWGEKELVLIVFNKKFELLDEIEFGKHKYNSDKSFVGKEGLYLSYAHYKNPEYDKYSLKFDILKIAKHE